MPNTVYTTLIEYVILFRPDFKYIGTICRGSYGALDIGDP